jgi:rhodanese-related sulfurtransferase
MRFAGKHTVWVAALSVLLAACSEKDGDGAEVRLLDVAQAAARGSDRVSTEELADWLVQRRADFVLIDVRTPGDFAAGAIGEARNLGVAELLSDEVLETLPRDRKLVIYSNGAENSAKAATLLRVAGFDARVLSGGYNAWHRRILNPDITAEEVAGESLQVSEQRALACYFVGDGGAAGERRPEVEFVPPVFEGDEALEALPLPPPTKESC